MPESTRRLVANWAALGAQLVARLATASDCAWLKAGSCRGPRRQCGQAGYKKVEAMQSECKAKEQSESGRYRSGLKQEQEQQEEQEEDEKRQGSWRDSRHGGRREDSKLARRAATRDFVTGENEACLPRAVSCRYIAASDCLSEGTTARAEAAAEHHDMQTGRSLAGRRADQVQGIQERSGWQQTDE